jgi:hypothetical protein
MPNECINHLTITSPSEQDIHTLLQKELPHVTINLHGKKGVRVKYSTAWKPDYPWLSSLLEKYPSCWIKNEWISEDGSAGVWVGDKNGSKFMEWNDLSLEDEYHHFQPVIII